VGHPEVGQGGVEEAQLADDLSRGAPDVLDLDPKWFHATTI
jgi:hypothetical protein